VGGAKVILATVPSAKAMSAVIGGLRPNGKLVAIGVSAEPIEVDTATIVTGQRTVAGFYSGTSIDSQDALAFSQRAGVRSMNEYFPLERALEAYQRMMSGNARFRTVLTMS
jgi:D-arabinose 1-dehydrogenase-like Zn-dependent alcohol dehydrogenase